MDSRRGDIKEKEKKTAGTKAFGKGGRTERYELEGGKVSRLIFSGVGWGLKAAGRHRHGKTERNQFGN